ncbi:MAG: hypothetical protein OXG11_01720 [Chloroflexi bacterium]|nr:hypothetical protein [Chloroflexota bacterium]
MYNAGNVLRHEFHKHDVGTEDEKARRRSLIIPVVIAYIFGIEVALKALIEEQGHKPAWIHDLLELYEKLSPETKATINAKASAIGIKVRDVRNVIQEHRNSLQEWRYREGTDGPLVVHLDTIGAILRATIETYTDWYGTVSEGAGHKSRGKTGVPPDIQTKASEYAKNVLGH